ncbi:aldo/keto reductase [Staphylococcus gallinarum]|uniref:aldo/keto reductase n=1 Tax=Staphylococcus gallinarum TaxID=1293 RepID=UPI000D1C5172|nr:aldo/keto reductase [Staphylococcus gallinarum]MBU7218631.1 aldo/keto reductase [Staphylococcus gallinarum]MCD8794062.1 aldo/keto reductase [Staphylococcus gallinarum]PTE35920.1 oxidoreductase [Staphylococcus gallinarum]PTK91358.1 oxidoreductase [Staphylococcus gallinarum]RIO84790.1 oxidoreductase [Staphylococcus gallinarum]
MEKVKINQHVSFSKLIQGFWRAKDWNWTAQELNRYINELHDRGITTMDHADIYGNYSCEGIFGEALKLSPQLREQLEIVSKCGIVLPTDRISNADGHRYDHSSQHIKRSVERSLQELNVEYLDSLLIHRPSPLMDPEEITDALKVLVTEGKVKSFGVSNFNKSQYDLINRSLVCDKLHITVNQLEVSPYTLDALDDGIINHMFKDDVKIMAWSPMAGGKLFDPKDERSQRIMTVITTLTEKYNVSTNSIIVAWLNKHPASIMPVLGTHNINRIDEAIDGFGLTLTDQEWFDIYTASLGHDIA